MNCIAAADCGCYQQCRLLLHSLLEKRDDEARVRSRTCTRDIPDARRVIVAGGAGGKPEVAISICGCNKGYC